LDTETENEVEVAAVICIMGDSEPHYATDEVKKKKKNPCRNWEKGDDELKIKKIA